MSKSNMPAQVGSNDGFGVVVPKCACGDRDATACPGEWEPGCDLGANAAFVRVADDIRPAMALTETQVNHLRRLLAWMRCEWMLAPDAQRGVVGAVEWMANAGHLTPEQAGTALQERADKINRCPAYVRQAVKMLTKAILDYESGAGIVEESKTPNFRLHPRAPEQE